MVRVINYNKRVSESGKEFYALTVQGGIEMIKSRETGNFYATAKKASIPSTFDEATCQALIGSDMPGQIEKIECEPYEYTVKDTGEVIILSHRYIYVPEEGNKAPKHQEIINTDNTDNQEFSTNGVHKVAMP